MDGSLISVCDLNVTRTAESQRYQKFTLSEYRRPSADEETGVDSSSSIDKLALSFFLLAFDLEVRLLSPVESIRFTWLGDASNL